LEFVVSIGKHIILNQLNILFSVGKRCRVLTLQGISACYHHLLVPVKAKGKFLLSSLTLYESGCLSVARYLKGKCPCWILEAISGAG